MRIGRLVLIAFILAVSPAVAAQAPAAAPAARTGDDAGDWLDLLGSGCVAVVFAAGVVWSLLERRPLMLHGAEELPPPRARRGKRDARRRVRAIPGSAGPPRKEHA